MVDFFAKIEYNVIEVILTMAPEGYELIKYKLYNTETWVLKDTDGHIWFPISELFSKVFLAKGIYASNMNDRQKKHTIRLRMINPRSALKDIPEQPKHVIIFGDLWCVKNLIRTRFTIKKEHKYKVRDMLIEEFGAYWGFSVAGFGVLTNKYPYDPANYPIIDQIFIAAEDKKETWLRCVECEKYYPKTSNFYGSTNSTCHKCLEKGFSFTKSEGAYFRVQEALKKRGKN